MESPAVSQLFRRLFSHETCSRIRYSRPLPFPVPSRAARGPYRCLSTRRQPNDGSTRESHWQQRTDIFPQDKLKEFEKYPMVTAADLRARQERPKRVKMLTRDFIEDSLYNPNYGYFSKQVVIFSPGEQFDFQNMKNEAHFHKVLGKRYTEFEDALDKESPNDTRQLWHTPTELFRPYYGNAIADYLVENYMLSHHPYHDLVIYELGAGNGTLMMNILDHIMDRYPSVYERTKYKVIEISSALAEIQIAQLRQTPSDSHADHVSIINSSIFDWNTLVPEPCYFLALEIFDNFAHDSIRYSFATEQPLQGTVLIDNAGDFYEFYTPTLDPVATRFLKGRNAACSAPFRYPLGGSRFLRNLSAHLPLVGNLTDPEYIPTRLMQFFDILHNYFPHHRLLASDFHTLPDSIKGFNAPVVQTRYRRRTVPVNRLFVQQGYFDILFPTDFAVINDIYKAITGKLTRVSTHEEFLCGWAQVKETETKSGENPMLNWYKNASVMTTV